MVDKRSTEGGFTIIELLIALTVLIIGLTGIVSLQMSGMRASAYSRHATEASVLAEDKMEELRTVPSVSLASGGPETVDAQGVDDPDGLYTREWTVTDDGTLFEIVVTVSWLERGEEPHEIILRTRRLM